MQNSVKKTISAIICGAVALASCGCGNTTGTALTIGDADIRAGIYIYYQMDALSEATSILSEEQPDLDMRAEDFDIKKHTIEGVNAEEWVKNKTIQLCKEHVAVEKLFDSYGLALTSEQTDEIKNYVFSTWNEENMYAQYIYGVDILGDYYEGLGVGEQSFKDCTTNIYKYDAIFEHLYGEGGEKGVPTAELDAGIVENYVATLQFEVDAAVATPQDYVDMITSGTSFTDAKAAYDKAAAIKEIEQDMADAAEAGEEYDGTLPEEVETVAVDESTLKEIVEKGTEIPTAEYVNEVFAMTNGETKVITVSETAAADDGTETTAFTYYVVQRTDITADAETMESYREKVLHDMKSSEYKDLIKAEADTMNVAENSAAIKLYTIDKLEK